MIQTGVIRSGGRQIPIWWDGQTWGKFGPVRVSVNKHGVRRFHQRVRRDIPLGDCAGEIQRSAASLMAYRLNGKRDGTWLLLCGPEPAFTMVCRPEFREQESGFVTPVWRLITVLEGHDHW